MLRFEDIRFDCALYNGYKPCRYGNECADCPHYSPLMPPAAESGPARMPVLTRPRSERFSVLLIKTGAMGDVLRTTTLLHPLHRAHPGAHVVWITDPAAMPLLAGNPLIAELLPFTPEQCNALTAFRFDLVMNYEKDRPALELAEAVEASRKVGFAPTQWGTPTVFSDEAREGLLLGLSDELKFRVNRKTYPRVIAEMAGLPWERDPYILQPGEAAAARRDGVLAMCPAGPHRIRVGLNTGCGSVFRTKQWTERGWLELVDHLQAHAPRADLLLLGGPAEEELNRTLAAARPGLVDTGSGNTLEEFFGVVDACDILVSSDSLAMHIGIALEKWVVAIFGSTSPVEVDLFDRGEKIVTDFDCAPCYLKSCDKQPTCMEALRGHVVGGAVMREILRHAAG